jgi:hypothetical protein
MKKIIFFLLFIPSLLFSQTDAERNTIIRQTNSKALKQLSKKYKASFTANKKLANQLAKIYNWQQVIRDKYNYSELIGVTPNNKPIYYTTYNEGAGITSRANKLYTGGGLGLHIQGENMVSALWDAGSALVTHELFSGRIQSVDNCPETNPHATHVAGTIIGTDQVEAGHARGMAFKASLNSYDWDNDEAEVALAAGSGLLLSNHSYGYSPFAIQDFQWGKYDVKAREFDEIMFNAPYYQFVCAAGNSRGNFNTSKNGYDLITGFGLCKNGITVASVEQVLNYTGPNSVIMSETSSWGPTDDGRIKPDIAAKGVNTFSAIDSSNSSYDYISGTSMASPSVNGTLLLLQQYYNQLNGSFMKAATLKGLMIHTADEAGSNPGPDYRFGWGLINAEKGANVITQKGLQSYILENTLAQNNTFSLDVNAIGIEPVIATLCWTDPKGNPHSLNVDDTTSDLVNDLDIRISQNDDTFYPWKLNLSNPANPATKADNTVDNVEKEEISNPSGTYTISVSHKGNLQNGAQNYSLIISGITLKEFWFTTVENSKSICNTANTAKYSFDLHTKAGFSENIVFSAVNLPAGITADFSPQNLNTAGEFDLTLGNLASLSPGNYPFIVRCQSDSGAFEMTMTLHILTLVFSPVILQEPLHNAAGVANPVLFSWLADSNAQQYDIQIATDNNFTAIVETATTSINSYTATALNSDRLYFWRVRNTNLCGNGNFSNPFTFSTACIAPSNTAMVNVNTTSATIGWTGNASSWHVEVVPQGTLPTGSGTTTNSNPTTFNNLQPNTCYDFYLLAECSTGTSHWLSPFTFCTTPDYCGGDHFYDSGGADMNYANNENKTTVIYPANPGDRVRAVFHEFDLENNDYMIVFNGPNDTYPFLVYASGNDSPGTIASTDPSGALTFVFHSNSNNTDDGWDASVICEPLPACPNPPDNLNLVAATLNSATLGWNENSGSIAWDIEVVVHNATPGNIPTDTAMAKPYTIASLLPNTCYDFYVRSRCTGGTSDWSGPFTFCTQANYCGGDHFYDTGGASGNYQNFEYKTTVIYPDATGDRVRAVFNSFEIENCCDTFKIYNGEDENAALLFTNQNNNDPPGIVVSSDPSGALTFVFSSDGHHTEDGWDATITCEPLPPCASQPNNIVITDITTTSANIVWHENSNATAWEIELLPQGNFPAAGAGTPINANTYAAINLNSNTCYDFFVRSICGDGASEWSLPASFCTEANYCGGDHFYDSGGAWGNYRNDENKTTTIAPDVPGERVRAIFNSFQIEACCDKLRIYNGPDTSYPLLYTSNNNPNPPTTIISTDISGALTFKFTSNSNTTMSGWDATIICEALPVCANPPGNINALNLSSRMATIGWSENSNATSWEAEIVLHNAIPTGSGTICNTNSHQFAGLNPSTCYDVYVRSICSGGPSAWTSAFNFCTEPDYCAGPHFYDSGGANGNYQNSENKTTTIYPGNPGDRVRAIFNFYQLESCCDYLRMYNGPDTSYPLLYSDGSTSPGSVASTDMSGALTFEFHSDGNAAAGGWDATILCEATPLCPDPPANLAASAITITSAILSWTENAGSNSWKIEMVPQGTTPTGNGTQVGTASYSALGLSSASCYDFYVQSICVSGTTGWSGPYTFCTLPDYCGGDHFYDSGGPSGNYQYNENKTTVIFPVNATDKVMAVFNTFNLESCCDYLRIYDGPNSTYPLLYSGGHDSPGTVSSTDTSGALAFEFHSDANANASGWDATITCTHLSTTDFGATFTNLEYYPNPVNRILNINAHEKIKKYALYNVEGKVIREAKINQEKLELDLQNLSSGNYFIKLTSDTNKSKTIKIIKD